LDSAGNEVTRPVFDDIRYIESKKIFAQKQNGKWFFIDRRGRPLILDGFDDFQEIDSYFTVVKRNGQCGMIDKHGKLVIPVKYDSITPNTFCGRRIIQVSKNGLYGLIDYNGKVIYNCKYSAIRCINGKVVGVK
jgi:hypothetical protein